MTRAELTALREKDPDRIGPSGRPRSKNAGEDRGEKNASGPHGPAAPSPWIRPLASYDRRERCELQVTRFGYPSNARWASQASFDRLVMIKFRCLPGSVLGDVFSRNLTGEQFLCRPERNELSAIYTV
jgi:hypothetical protein